MICEFSSPNSSTEKRLRIVGLTGRRSELETLEGVLSSPEYTPGIPWLVDNRGVRGPASVADADRLAEFLSLRISRIGPVELLWLTDDDSHFALSRMLQAALRRLPVQLRCLRSSDKRLPAIEGHPA